MRFIYFFAMMFVLAACDTMITKDEAPAQSERAPETRPPVNEAGAKRANVISRLRKNPHLSVQLFNDNNTIFVQMRSGESFQIDNVSPTPTLMRVLDYVANVLNDSGEKYEIRAVGHADNIGSQQAIVRASEQRALAVALYLAGKGIDRQLISSEGRGSQYPIADNSTQEGRDVNRRVDLLIRPVQNKTSL